jgi:exonuclease SbcC
MITKVKLSNWRSHLNSEFSFSSGTNALLGSMGSGKTSVLDSICFAIFGTFPNLQSKKLRLDDILMKKPSEKNNATVEVELQLDGKIYTIKRTIERGKGTSYSEIRENEKLLEAPNSQRVTEMIEKILKVNYELFSKAIYSEQNALDYFLTIPKGQRMRKIDELLAIDKFEKARMNTVSLINKLADRKSGKQSIIDKTDVELLQKNILGLKNSLEQTLGEKNTLKKTLDEVVEERVGNEQEVNLLKKIKEDLEILKRDERGIISAVEEISKSLQELEKTLKGKSQKQLEKNMGGLIKGIEDIEKNLRDKRLQYEKVTSDISQFRTKIDFLKTEKIQRLEKELPEKFKLKEEWKFLISKTGEDVSGQLEQKKNLLQKTVEDFQSLKTKIEEMQESILKLSYAESFCPVCDSKLTDERKNLLIQEKQTKIDQLKESFLTISKDKHKLEEELKMLETASKRMDEIIIQIKDLENMTKDFDKSKKDFLELSTLAIKTQNELTAVRNDIEDLEKKSLESSEEKKHLEILFIRLKDFEEKKKRYDDLIDGGRIIETRIKETESKLVGKDFALLEKQLRNLIGKEKEIETKISSFDQLIKEKELRINEYEVALNNVLKEREEVGKLEKLIKELRIFEIALEKTQIELRTEFVEAVNFTMNKLWNTLYPYQDFVGIKLSIEEGDYVLQLKERSGRFINADGIASGGERSIACLALRIAFALVLAPQLRWLVLDEPTANLDVRAIEDLAETLRERIGEFVDQVFLITHDEKLEGAVTGSLYRLEREKEKEGVTRIVLSN